MIHRHAIVSLALLTITSTCILGGCAESDSKNGGDDTSSSGTSDETSASQPTSIPSDATDGAAEDPVDTDGRVHVSGMSFQPDDAWPSDAPAMSMRVAQFDLPAPAEDVEDATLVVYYFGATGAGSIQLNIDRWIGQITQPDGTMSMSVADIGKRSSDGMAIVLVDVPGTYTAETFPGSSERHNKENWRLRGAVVSTAAGPYYFKLIGPDETIQHWSDSWMAMIDSVRKGPVTETGSTGHP